MNLQAVTVGQYFPGDSLLHRLDPRTKVMAILAMSGLIFLPRQAPALVFTGAFCLWAVWLSRVPLLYILRGLRPLMILLTITLLFNIFLTPGEPLLRLGTWVITREGLTLSFLAAFRLIFLVICASLMTLTTSPIKLTDGIERLLRPLTPLGVPAHELALMMTIALRFIPTLTEEADRIIRAQTARGGDFQSGNVIKRVQGLIPVLIPLFVSAFRRADELAIAMEARGYRGGQGRTRMKELSISRLDVGAWAVLFMFAVIVITLRIRGLG